MKDTHMIDRLSHDQLWDQVIRREPGDFLYAVDHDGRLLPARAVRHRARLRKNVRFFRTNGEAETAGFRACKRCDPKGERARLAQAVVQDACAFIEASEEIPSLDALAARSGYSRFHFLRMFRDHTGLTPRSYAEGVRARRLHAALSGGARVADAVADAGYGSESRVYEKTGELLGMTPGALRRGGDGEVIRTAFADCPFGRLLVGATDRGVCFIGFAEPDEALLGDLRQRFPRARIVADDAALAEAVQRGARLSGGAEAGARPAARSARHRLPAARLAHAVPHPAGRDAQLRRTRPHGRRSPGGACRGTLLRSQSGFAGGAVPPRHRQ